MLSYQMTKPGETAKSYNIRWLVPKIVPTLTWFKAPIKVLQLVLVNPQQFLTYYLMKKEEQT